jgi:hypothetical protein
VEVYARVFGVVFYDLNLVANDWRETLEYRR